MNIFYLSECPKQCAEWMVDKHVIKMILESAQLLSTAHRLLDGTMYVETKVLSNGKKRNNKKWKLPDYRDDIIYGATHINHPSAVWVRESNKNYLWLFQHTVELTREYTYRYGKRHKCCDLLGVLGGVPQNIPDIDFTQPTPAMDKQYIISGCSIENYRNYYVNGKSHLKTYKNRNPPPWWK